MANNSNPNKKRSNGPGRGWHGNSDAHARAGRLGGLARRRNFPRNEEETATNNGNPET